MPSFEAIVFAFTFLALLAIGIALLVVLRGREGSSIVDLAEAGRFEDALNAFRARADPNRDELIAAARAARHLLELEDAQRLIDRQLATDPDDGEAWLEAALIAAYDHRADAARAAFERVPASRSDLLEMMTLHRAWLELFANNEDLARRLFDEVEVSLETKLRDDLGGGDPAFVELFLHAGCLWRCRGKEEDASWALAEARKAVPLSALPDRIEQWLQER